jgi:hypothetical protein
MNRVTGARDVDQDMGMDMDVSGASHEDVEQLFTSAVQIIDFL